MNKKTKQSKPQKILYIETGIDRLLKTIQKDKKIMISDAVKMFGVSKDVIEGWGSILENKKLIKMHYPLMGEPSLQSITAEEKKSEKKYDEKKKIMKETVKEKVAEKKAEAKKGKKEMGMGQKIKNVLFHPSKFFEYTRTEDGIGGTFKFIALLGLIPLAIFIIIGTILSFFLALIIQLFLVMLSAGGTSATAAPFALIGIFLGTMGLTITIIMSIFLYGFILIMPFISAGILHLLAGIIFKGKGRYKDAYRVAVYSSTPTFLFGWFIFGLFWQIYLIVKGISVTYRISMLRSFLATVVVPITVAFVVFVALNILLVLELLQNAFSTISMSFISVFSSTGEYAMLTKIYLILIVIVPIIIIIGGFLAIRKSKKTKRKKTSAGGKA